MMSSANFGIILLVVLLFAGGFAFNFEKMNFQKFFSRVNHLQKDCVNASCHAYLPPKDLCWAVGNLSSHFTAIPVLSRLLSSVFQSFAECETKKYICDECLVNYVINTKDNKCAKDTICFADPITLSFVQKMKLANLSSVEVFAFQNCDDLVIRLDVVFPQIALKGVVKANITEKTKKGSKNTTERVIQDFSLDLMNGTVKMELRLTPNNATKLYEISDYKLLKNPNFSLTANFKGSNDTSFKSMTDLVSKEMKNLRKTKTVDRIMGKLLPTLVKNVVSAYFNICLA